MLVSPSTEHVSSSNNNKSEKKIQNTMDTRKQFISQIIQIKLKRKVFLLMCGHVSLQLLLIGTASLTH